MTKSISIIGPGRVGSALLGAFTQAGYSVDTLISRREKSVQHLPLDPNTKLTTNLSEALVSDMVIVSVPDDALLTVVEKINIAESSILVHTAGSHGLEVFKTLKCKTKGVFYPLQTFSEGRVIDVSTVPILIEAESDKGLQTIKDYALCISKKVYEVDSDRRKLVHLAAVFACNFVNHIYGLSKDLADKSGLPFSILEPLIEETLDKAKSIGPKAAQTGPAARNDKLTIEKHMELLSFSSELAEIYKTITNSIMEYGKSD